MDKLLSLLFVILIGLSPLSCKSKANSSNTPEKIKVGAEAMQEYLPLLKGKRVGLIINHTSTIGKTHLLDTLLSSDVNVTAIFAPEHGFRGDADAGAHIDNSKDAKTGISIVSLYGKNKKPTAEQIKGIDIFVFDIQDVGVRFYTYISTLHYIIEAASENNKPLIVLDRPNPNGHYVAGPVLEKEFKSFVGMNPIPVVYGLTMGELAEMINGESWANKTECDLTVIKCENYDHTSAYELPIKPSPNLPNAQSIYLYPSICFFEPTQISVGRGTDNQFQVIGGPDKNLGNYHFIPTDKPGAHNPVNKGIDCYGLDLRKVDAFANGFDLKLLFDFYNNFEKKSSFFTNEKFFNLLTGNSWILKDLKAGKSAEEVQGKWQEDLKAFKTLRKKYLLYTDFE
ncbi:exo-beta-N-acetylmuramidase NamZ family protein [Arcticibacterium luteifluviistationis]|uniref:DUF1343 domain-containing protein n=1 Tax=Arcticibacterium luteifluviistationis TaxID=1784714 RepID=A0A2Z4GB31_9BACT|nr:DUF1343 domain-containing protein [Arcticibacterium luteifluviistationis]AWV98407.1 DUF1343 domain-containing protein [Arcticibacterium luteifluviistationis]